MRCGDLRMRESGNKGESMSALPYMIAAYGEAEIIASAMGLSCVVFARFSSVRQLSFSLRVAARSAVGSRRGEMCRLARGLHTRGLRQGPRPRLGKHSVPSIRCQSPKVRSQDGVGAQFRSR